MMKKSLGYAIIAVAYQGSFHMEGAIYGCHRKRRDNKNRILNTGESQKAKRPLMSSKYTDGDGKPKFI